MKSVVFALVALSIAVACAYVQVYKVEPVKAAWSGWTRRQSPNNYVSQVVTCCWASLSAPAYVEGFFGSHGAGGNYNLEVKEYPSGGLVARKLGVAPGRDHRWLRFDSLEILGAFTKGKQYEFRFTRSGNDSIQYYYNPTDPYKYGQMLPVGSQGPRALPAFPH